MMRPRRNQAASRSGGLEIMWDNYEKGSFELKPTHITLEADYLLQPQLPDIVHF